MCTVGTHRFSTRDELIQRYYALEREEASGEWNHCLILSFACHGTLSKKSHIYTRIISTVCPVPIRNEATDQLGKELDGSGAVA